MCNKVYICAGVSVVQCSGQKFYKERMTWHSADSRKVCMYVMYVLDQKRQANTSHQRWHTRFSKCNEEDYLSDVDCHLSHYLSDVDCHLGWRTLVLKCNKNNYD